MPKTRPDTGSTQFGKYLLVERIAKGGMAEIFKAKSYGVSGFEKTIVIKRVMPEYSDDREFIEMLIDEAKICASLQHANIVQIFDLGRLQGHYYIAMEYVHGVDLATVLGRLRKAKQRLPLELCCYIMSQALNGLDYAHRATGQEGEPLNIVHRDFNPANILLSYLGEVKVADFGIARASRRNTRTMAGGLKGKMGYLSPEQVLDLQLDARSDIFTAGITLWEMITCQRLFTGKSDLDVLLAIRDVRLPDIRKLVSDLDEEMVQILLHALQRNPENRFRSALEFREALDDFLFERGIKVNQSHLEAYLKHLFADRLEEEKRQKTGSLGGPKAPPRYWVKVANQGPQGPFTFEQISEQLQQGELPLEAKVMREGEQWKTLKNVPELAVHLSRLPSGDESDPTAAPTYQGLIAEVGFPKLFYRLAIARESGRLVLNKQTVKKEIFFREGVPEFVRSNVDEEMLGEYLVRHGIISEQQRREAVAAMQQHSGRLGDTLIALRILQPHEMFENLQQQVREKILEVFAWAVGTYRFFSGQNYIGEILPLKLGSFALIAEGVRRFSPLEMMKNRVRPYLDRPVQKLNNPYLTVEQLHLNPREQRVADSIDGKISARGLLALGGSDRQQFEEAVYRVLYLLDEVEMISFGDKQNE